LNIISLYIHSKNFTPARVPLCSYPKTGRTTKSRESLDFWMCCSGQSISSNWHSTFKVVTHLHRPQRTVHV